MVECVIRFHTEDGTEIDDPFEIYFLRFGFFTLDDG